MSRRVSLPAADELFRRTSEARLAAAPEPTEDPAPDLDDATETLPSGVRSSGRIRHDEKMTVYLTADELLDLEHARLSLRRHHAIAVDRGRLVREAIAIALDGLDEEQGASALVRRLTGS